jgi:hypothetical protein
MSLAVAQDAISSLVQRVHASASSGLFADALASFDDDRGEKIAAILRLRFDSGLQVDDELA